MKTNADQGLESALKSINWFRDLKSEQINRLIGIAQLRNVGENEYLFHEGDKEDFLFVLIKGCIAIEVSILGRGPTALYHAEPTDIIGWSSVTPVIRQRTASARAVDPSQLIALESIKLRELCDGDNELGYLIMRRLANVVATRLLVTRLELIDLLSPTP